MKENRLANEKSPYLRQHRHNPVDWYAWGEEAFRKAAAEDKPIFLSIGYSTCYWCHVMEKDSFEQNDVALLLNQNFISIKVDREERPDVDDIYMDAVVAFSGHGGWPMSVFLTPDRKPFFGATFFPRDQFKHLLETIGSVWRTNRAELLKNAEVLTEYLHRSAGSHSRSSLHDSLSDRAAEHFRETFDEVHGGFGGAPKFPPTSALPFLLQHGVNTNDSELLHAVTFTLDAIGRGGICDQLGGGFHRYSVDAEWKIPHFEKMLYDNALLTRAYLEAFQVTNNRHYAEIARDTCNFVLRELQAPTGGFYSALDAGEVGREGEFYAWTYDQVRSLLSDELFEPFAKAYTLEKAGNFEHGTNVLCLRADADWHLREDPSIREARNTLFLARARRPHPHRDEKVLTGWNGLMISALARAYQVLGEDRFLAAATAAADFLEEQLFPNDKLLRRFCDGEAGIHGCLEDYAYFTSACLTLAETVPDSRWIRLALRVQEAQDAELYDSARSIYLFAPPSDESLLVQKSEFHDGALPSPNGVTVMNLFRLFHLTGNQHFQSRARDLLERAAESISRFPAGFVTALTAFEFERHDPFEVTVFGDLTGEEAQKALNSLWRTYQPGRVLGFGEVLRATGQASIVEEKGATNGLATFYVCRHQTCLPPVTTAHDLLENLRVSRPRT